jgi:hypothetical protein
MKKIVALLLIASIAGSGVSCKFIKKKFGKKEAVVTDSTSVGEGEFADDGASSELSDADLLSDTSTTSSASNSSSASTDALATNSSEATTETKATPAKEETKPVAKTVTTTSTKSVATSPKAKGTTTNSNALVAPQAPTRHGGRSSSIYDGINDQEERAIIRRAEGYNDAGYVDDYNGSNQAYEQHYKKASELDGGTNYIVPASGYADGRQPNISKKGKTLPNTPSHAEPIARPADAKNNAGSGTSQIGTVPTKVDQKPKSANDIIQKK